MKLSVVIPCYRSEHTIANVVKEIIDTIPTCKDVDDYEIIMVSDGSPDNVFSVIRRLCEENPKCKGLEFSRNYGQHAALLAGYHCVTGDIVTAIDDDGQTPLESLPELLTALKNGADVVCGSYEHKQHNWFRRFGSRFNNFMAEWLMDKPKNWEPTSFIALRRYIIDELIRYDNAFPYMLGLVLRATNRFANIPVKHRQRNGGQSGYRLGKLIKLWLNGATAFSIKPLRIAALLGVTIAVGGLLLGMWIICQKLINPNVPAGYASMMSVMAIFSGTILLTLGLMGEYIGRMYICINKSPQFVIRDKINMEHLR